MVEERTSGVVGDPGAHRIRVSEGADAEDSIRKHPPEYKHTPEMGEISGFGGGYEATCQGMLHAGVVWLKANAHDDVKVETIQNVFGLAKAETKQAKSLEDAVLAAPDAEGCSSAMHQAVMMRLAWIAKNSWEDYVAKVTAGRKQNST